MTKSRAHRQAIRGASLALVACVALVVDAHAASPRRTAHAARTVNISDKAHLRPVSESGANLVEEGEATGSLPGRVRVRFNLGVIVYASFSISTPYGSISGSGSSKLHGTGVWDSFGGTVTVAHGTGRYLHARGHAGFYGVINRRTDVSNVQTTGTLAY